MLNIYGFRAKSTKEFEVIIVIPSLYSKIQSPPYCCTIIVLEPRLIEKERCAIREIAWNNHIYLFSISYFLKGVKMVSKEFCDNEGRSFFSYLQKIKIQRVVVVFEIKKYKVFLLHFKHLYRLVAY